MAGASDRQLRGDVDRAVLGHDHDAHVGTVLGDASGTEVEILVVVIVVVVTGDGDAGLGARRAQARHLGLLEVRLGTTGPRQDGLHELLV